MYRSGLRAGLSLKIVTTIDMGIVQVSVLKFYRLYIDHLTTGLKKGSFARKLAMCQLFLWNPKENFSYANNLGWQKKT